MENSQIERSAAAAVAAPTIPLEYLIRAEQVLRAIRELPRPSEVPFELHLDASSCHAGLKYFLDLIVGAQSVGVTA